jgi:predicted MPP superfamily phosphohydrolase
VSRVLTFIAVAIAIIAGIHCYIWMRLVRDPRLPAPWSGIATVALIALAVGLPASLLLGRRFPDLRRVLAWPLFIWLGLMFLLLCILVSIDGARGIASIGRRLIGAGPIDEQRRTFVSRLLAAGASAVAMAAGALGVRAALGAVRVRPVRVRLAKLPRAHDGLRIVQLTDVHVGPTIGRAFIEEIVRQTNALAPDIVAITGDLVDGSVSELGEAVAPIANLRARHGVYFVTGNHEYFSDAPAWMNELARLGIRVLRNERVTIGEDQDAFDLAGVDDRSAAHHGGLPPEAAVARALEGRDPARELVLLAHQPKSLLEAAAYGVGLQLSGHTHGGQVWPFGYLVRLMQPFLSGLHRQGQSQIYVSRGTGYWGPPMRLGEPAEITHLTLESGQA